MDGLAAAAATGAVLRSRELTMGPAYVESDVVPTLQAQRDTNCALGLPSVKKEGLRDKHVALVGFGPSLKDTWPRLKDGGFDAIWTVSMAHDFLVDRGVIPTFHTDTDYRQHKAYYNKQWQPERTVYRMATQLHPVYIPMVVGAGCRVEMFHVVQPNGGLYDPRYLKQPVGFDAGLQTARLAYELGYRNQTWFGMDASARGTELPPADSWARGDHTHAGPHHGVRPGPMMVEVAGKQFVMSAFFVRQALFCEQMLCKLPHLKATITGDGALRPLLQERGRCQVF